jgi:outer membrane protein assembly factor BamD
LLFDQSLPVVGFIAQWHVVHARYFSTDRCTKSLIPVWMTQAAVSGTVLPAPIPLSFRLLLLMVSYMRSSFRDSTQLPFIRVTALVLLALMLAMTGCKKDRDRMDDRNASELYEDAKQSLENHSWARAIMTYKQLQTRYPFGRFTEQSMLDLSYAYYKAREPENAMSTLDRFIRTYPTHPNIDYAYYLKGLVGYDQNLGFLERMMPDRVRDRDQSASRAAFMDFNELMRRFPDSRYVPDARQRMVFLRNNLASYEIIVADYYMRRQAYIAAANRARYALENYPGTPQNADALIVLHQAYTELKLPELASDTWNVLEVNYPDNYYVLGQKKKKSWAKRLWPFD